MPIDPSQPTGHRPPVVEPTSNPAPAKKPQIPRQPTSGEPERHIAGRKIVNPRPLAKEQSDPQSQESDHNDVGALFTSNQESGVSRQTGIGISQAARSRYANEFAKIYSETEPSASTLTAVNSGGSEETEYSALAPSLSPKALTRLLAMRDNIIGARTLLNGCTPEQRMALSDELKFPGAWYAALNRRLLADVLIDSIHKNHNNLFFHAEDEHLINSANAVFHEKHLDKNILNNPLAAAHLFRNLLNQRPVFTEQSVIKLSKMMSDDIERLPETLIEELKQSLEKMTPDEKDHFLVSIGVMIHAFRHAEENHPEQSKPRPGTQLAQLFAQSIFQIPPLPNLARDDAAKELPINLHSQAGYFMQIMLSS